MSALTIPNTFVANTVAASAQVNANFTAVAAVINGNIDHSNTVSSTGFYASDIKPLTAGEATFGATATGVGYKFLANDATATPLTVSGVSGQTAQILNVTPTSGGTPSFSVGPPSFGTAVQFLTVTPSNAPSFPPAAINGDGTVQRSASTGFQWWGGASGAAGMEWNITNGSSFSLRNSANNGYVPISGGAYTNASDASLKTSIQPVADALTSTLTLKPVSFSWKDSGLPGLGFLAQDVQAVLPDLVSTDADGIMGVNYDGIIPVCVAAIQELAAQFNAYVAGHP